MPGGYKRNSMETESHFKTVNNIVGLIEADCRRGDASN